VDASHPTRHTPPHTDQRGAGVWAWCIDAPYGAPPAGCCAGCMRLAQDRCHAGQGEAKPMGRTMALASEAMWHSLKPKQRKRWLWKALDWETDRDATGHGSACQGHGVTKGGSPHHVGRVNVLHRQRGGVCLGHPPDKRVQSQATTHATGCNHCRRRHGCRCVKHTSIIIARSQAMVELAMTLCAQLWGNGNQDALLSRCACNAPSYSQYKRVHEHGVLGRALAVVTYTLRLRAASHHSEVWRGRLLRSGTSHARCYSPLLPYGQIPGCVRRRSSTVWHEHCPCA
jgi:hypothetical protein